MKRFLMAVLAAGILPACGAGSRKVIPAWPGTWYTSPKGTVYGFIGPWPAHAPDYYPSDDDDLAGEEYLTRLELETELDLAIDAGAAAQGGDPAYARSYRFVIVDDFGFATAASPTGFAGGMVTHASRTVFVSIWTRYEGTPDPASIPAGSPSWTHRPPGLNGYPMWRYGFPPYLPTMTHEL